MNRIFTYRFALCLLAVAGLLASCTKEVAQESQSAISFALDLLQTRAYIFDTQSSLTNPAIGGDDFTVHALFSDTKAKYIDGANVNYFDAAADWRFTDSGGNYTKYYWPITGDLDFFAYFPANPDGTAVSNIEATVPSFDFSLPLDAQENLKEFIFAYAPGKNKTNAASGVALNFAHPFAAVKLRLGVSYRMTINSISINNISYSGKYRYSDGAWTLDLSKDSSNNPLKDRIVINIGKDVPDHINFNGPIGGPYLVAPQDLNDNVTLSVNYTRLDGNATADTKTVTLYRDSAPVKWEAGKIYTYTLNLGNTDEEILFQVDVENWKIISYPNEIVVE